MPKDTLAIQAEQRILILRDQKVMLDFHLAELYGVETRALKQAVRRNPERFSTIARIALRKLIQMNHAGRLADLSVPPGNRLELLKGSLAGFHSIRINGQWRIIFRWTEAGPAEVAIVDYH